MGKIILVALDASDGSPRVLHAAMDQARALHAKLLLLRAVGIPPELPPEAMSVAPDEFVKMLTRNAEKDLAEHARRVPSEMLLETVAELGTPWRTICEIARSRDVSLIVMGAHGHRWSDRLLGTNAERVVSHADRSVLVVRDPELNP